MPLSYYHVKPSDSLLLLRRRGPLSTLDPVPSGLALTPLANAPASCSSSPSKAALAAVTGMLTASEASSRPTEVVINQVTANVTQRNGARNADKPQALSNYLNEMRKIILSLIQVSHKVLCYNKEAVDMFREATAILKASRRSEAVVDRQVIVQLSEIGFSEAKAKAALILNDMSVELAMEWLLANGEEDEATLIAMSQSYRTSPSSSSSATEDTSEDPATSAASEGLRVLQEFHRLSFKPDEKALKSLVEMGFEAKLAVNALRVHGNNQNLACDWLLGSQTPSLEEWQKGLDPDTNMYSAIVNNPLVQLSLNNPKILLALEDILDHPNTMSHYLNDPEAGPLLVQISSIYSTERHGTSAN